MTLTVNFILTAVSKYKPYVKVKKQIKPYVKVFYP